MFIEDELIPVKWHNSNRAWYEERGYTYTKLNQEILIRAKDLPPGSAQKITAICDYCGNTYKMNNDWYQKIMCSDLPKCACKNCFGKKVSESRLQKERDDVFNELERVCEDNGYKLITDKTQYTGKKGKIKFICSRHGEQEMIVDNLLHGHKCFDCSYETRFDNIRKSQEEVKLGIESINENTWLNPGEFRNVTTPNLRIMCGLCKEHSFTVSYSNYLKHGVNRCRHCSTIESIGEKMVREYLEQHNIRFVSEYRGFIDCKDLRVLPYDFYLCDYNAVIEFDGEQHYWDIYGDGSFEKTQKHDQIKNNYCMEHNIPLLRIPYWYRDNNAEFEQLLNIFINSLNIIQVEDIV